MNVKLEQIKKNGLLHILDRATWIIPYAVAAFLAGMLVMGWRAELKLERQYEARLQEANMRVEVLKLTTEILTQDKFRGRDALAEAVKKVNARESSK